MSAAAALQKWLELKNRTSTTIFLPNPTVGDTKMGNEELWAERMLDIFIYFMFYILIRVFIFFSNWYSRYQYFKTKKPSSSTTHAIYFSWFYCTASGE